MRMTYFDGSGAKLADVVTERDENGVEVRTLQEFYDVDSPFSSGPASATTEYLYDEQGRQVGELRSYNDDEQGESHTDRQQVTEVEFDEAGSVTRSVREITDNVGEKDERTKVEEYTYAYDDQGRLTQEVTTTVSDDNDDPRIVSSDSETTYEYNEDGVLVRETRIEDSGTYITTNDEKGRLIRYEVKDGSADDEVNVDMYSYEEDENGYVVKVSSAIGTTYRSDAPRGSRYEQSLEYNDHGDVVKDTCVGKGDGFQAERTYSYEYGSRDEVIHEVEYDENGVPIEEWLQAVGDDGAPITVTRQYDADGGLIYEEIREYALIATGSDESFYDLIFVSPNREIDVKHRNFVAGGASRDHYSTYYRDDMEEYLNGESLY